MPHTSTDTPAESTPPNAKLTAVEDALASSGERIGGAVAELEAGRSRTTEINDVVNQAMSDISVNQQTVVRTRLNADLQEQNANIDILNASGGTSAQVEAIAELQADEDEIDRLTKERTAIFEREFKFFPDILANAFGSIGNSIRLDSARRERDQTKAEIQNITGAQESFISINSKTKKTLNEAAIKANLDIIASENRIKASEREIQNIHSNADAMGRIVAMDSQQVSNRLAVARFEQEKESMELNRERLKFQKERMEFDRKKFELQMPTLQNDLARSTLALEEAKFTTASRRVAVEARAVETKRQIESNLNLMDEQVEAVQKGQSSAGIPIESFETVIEGLRVNPAKYEQLRNVGADPRTNLGGSPAEAINTLRLVDPDGNAIKTKGTALLDAIKTEQMRVYQEQIAKKTGFKIPNDPNVIAADLNATAKQFMDAQATNITAGNPYVAPPMESLAPMLEGKNIALYDRVIKPLELTEVNQNIITDAAVAAVQANVITAEQAAEGIEAIFETAALFNNEEHGGFTRVGLPSQVTYNAVVDVPTVLTLAPQGGGFLPTLPSLAPIDPGLVAPGATSFLSSNTRVVDFMDVSQVQAMIVMKLSAAKAVNPATPTTTPNSPAPKTLQTPPQEGP